MSTYYNPQAKGFKQGLLPFPPYYWWESGAFWGTMLDYSRYTGDGQYDELIGQGILSQGSPTTDFMMWDQAFNLGNDDQVFWGLSAMTAAENLFPLPEKRAPNVTNAIWYQLSRGVFQNMVRRWNTTLCAGGLKWQFLPENRGFDYRSTITNVGFFQLAARLARFSGNSTYGAWADKSWSWMEAVGLIDKDTLAVYDGAGDVKNCTEVNKDQWSYNMAVAVHGAAVMWNTTGDAKWKARTQGIVANAKATFFSPFPNATYVMFERKCEREDRCDNDQRSFKAYDARWLAKAGIMCPDVAPAIAPLLRASAAGAAKSCTGGERGTTCGTKWYTGHWDGTQGVGQQMSAHEVFQSLLAGEGSPPHGMPHKGVPGVWMDGILMLGRTQTRKGS